MRTKLLRHFILGLAIVFSASSAFAYKLDFMLGYYALDAETSTASGSASGVGSYKLGYVVPVTNQFEFSLGYTLILADTFGGDAAFGIDLEMYYFVFGPTEPLTVSTEAMTAVLKQKWAPFVGAGFHQRQFQSVQTQYNGFSLIGGVEKNFQDRFSYKAMFRYMFLNGADAATATVMDALAGVSFRF